MRNSVHSRGFTLVELLTTIAIVGILASFAIPNMRTFLQNNRLAASGNDLLHAIQVARTEAIKRQGINPATGLPVSGSVSVCATADSTVADASLTCNNGTFSQWFIFYDVNNDGQHATDGTEPVLGRGAVNTSLTVKTTASSGILCYGPSGFQNVSCGTTTPTRAVVMCDARGNQAIGLNSTARALIIAPTGRSRISALLTDVNAALTSIGVSATCP